MRFHFRLLRLATRHARLIRRDLARAKWGAASVEQSVLES